jgi:hypothetical protein
MQRVVDVLDHFVARAAEAVIARLDLVKPQRRRVGAE